MGFFNQRPRRHYSRFDRALDEEKHRRIQFQRLQHYERPRGRSLFWLLVMLAAVAYLLYYLSQLN
ncbi:MAG: hypothetical protein K9N22_05495 [Candidatus Marinimicrobia bacterium]|nr:hypothetical protein [Candidatus Neomarinimicrobiota bacterium]MCF7902381.1 hypothetical protein [Candidatus Neomarinimicrobiota bacterium]